MTRAFVKMLIAYAELEWQRAVERHSGVRDALAARRAARRLMRWAR